MDEQWDGRHTSWTRKLNIQDWSFLGGLGIMGTEVPEVTGMDKVFRETEEKVLVPHYE